MLTFPTIPSHTLSLFLSGIPHLAQVRNPGLHRCEVAFAPKRA